MAADRHRARDRPRAMLVDRRLLGKADGRFVHAVLIGARSTLRDERRTFVEDRPVSGDPRVLQRGIDEPEPIVFDARAHAFSAGLVPPVLHVALRELTPRGPDDVPARDTG